LVLVARLEGMKDKSVNEAHPDGKRRPKGVTAGAATAIGVGVGVALYSATDSLLVAVGVGLALGVGVALEGRSKE